MSAQPARIAPAPAPQPRELPLTWVLEHRQSVLWPEAVAIVAEVVDSVLQHPDAAAFPRVEQISILSGGALRIQPGARHRGALASRARQLLADLLAETPAPAPLMAVANDALGEADELGAIAAALQHFLRPNRSDELASLFRRIDAMLHGSSVDHQLAAMVAQATEAKASKQTNRPTGSARWQALKARASGLKWLVPFASVVVLVALAMPWRLPSDARVPAAAPPVQMASMAEPSTSDAVTSVGRETPTSPRYATGATAARVPARRRSSTAGPARTRVSQAGSAPGPAAPVAAAEPALGEGMPALAGADVTAPTAPPRYATRPSPVAAPTPSEVFTPGSPGVTPPVLTSQLPEPTTGAASQPAFAVLDVLINEHGAVERVALVSQDGHQERLLVWAAKAWTFRPARKDGAPVRYRARLRVPL